MIRNNYFFLFFLLLLIHTGHLNAKLNLYFDHLSVKDGLSHYSVNSLYQDENGMVWIGTRDGLNRYDGNEITVYRQDLNDDSGLFGNNIRSVCGDKNGYLFMQCKSGVVVFDLRTEKFKILKKENIQSISSGREKLWFTSSDSVFSYNPHQDKLELEYLFSDKSLRTTATLESNNQLFYTATNNLGLQVYDKNKKLVKQFPIYNVITLYEDSKRNIWACTRFDGLVRIDFSGRMTSFLNDPNNPESIPGNFVRSITEDDFGNYWVGMFVGLCRFNPTNEEFIHIKYDRTIPHGLSNSSVWTTMKDNQGTIWIGSYFGGIDLFSPKHSIFNFYDAYSNSPYSLNYPVIGRIIEDETGNLWLATDGGGIIYYDRKTGLSQVYQHTSSKNSISTNTIKSMWLDKERQNLWIGTHLGGLNKLNLKTKEITVFKHNPNDNKSIPNNSIREILYKNDTLYLATHNSVGLFDLTSETCSNINIADNVGLNNRELTDIFIDSDNRLWAAYTNNIIKFDLMLHKTVKYKSSNNTLLFFQDSKNRLWAGTDGGGFYLYNENNNSFTPCEEINKHLQSKYIIDIKESKGGYFYIATNSGLTITDNEFKSAQLLNKEKGFPLEALNENSIHITNENEVFVGGINGMVSFQEKDVNIPGEKYAVNITGLKVNNKKIIPGEESIIQQSLPYTNEITLKSHHSVLNVLFSTTNYISVLKTDIQYRLIGFDDDFIDANYQQNITYTNLNPGSYILKLRGKTPTSEGIYPEKALKITVLPPFYRTNIAYILYLLSALTISYLLIRFYTSKIKLKTSLEYEKREKKHIENMNQSKLRFFTNISHEFRTPLTLIINQIELILQSGNIPQTIYTRLLNVMRNATMMKKLIGELIDFRKYEQGFTRLKVAEYDLVPFLNDIYMSFKEFAQSRQINYTFEYKNPDIKLWMDINQMEKVFYNLLANAFKYTSPQDNITIKAEEIGLSVLISIIDSGIGLNSEEMKKVFDRFYQVENSSVDWTNQGSGIGLSLAKAIVDLHHGEIGVESTPNAGSRFWVKLPVGDSSFSEEEKIASISKETNIYIPESDLSDNEFVEEIKKSQIEANSLNSKILIVEDNEDVLNLLSNIFRPIYDVYTALNGEEGFEKAIKLQPDIILSDVMMPRMSGTEMCSKLKSNLETCHIPVVLLTAQTASNYVIQGLLIGADDYITKPFNVKVLITRCNNLVNSRKIFQKKFALAAESQPQLIATNSIDQKLLEKATSIVEQNMDSPTFDIRYFASEMCLSRTNLFNKIKGITGQTPNDFIITTRLKKSLYYVKNMPEMSITDIAIKVGFSSTSYFIKKFSTLYGSTPSQYRKELKENKNN